MVKSFNKTEITHDNSFEFAVTLKEGYILMELSGILYDKGIDNAVSALFQISEESGIKRVLYDTSHLKQSDKARKHASVQFKVVSARMDRLASYIPNYPIFATAKFMAILVGVKNWKPFRTREKAIEWLQS